MLGVKAPTGNLGGLRNPRDQLGRSHCINADTVHLCTTVSKLDFRMEKASTLIKSFRFKILNVTLSRMQKLGCWHPVCTLTLMSSGHWCSVTSTVCPGISKAPASISRQSLVLTHTIPRISQETRSAVGCLLGGSAERAAWHHPSDGRPGTTSPYPLCFAWLTSGLPNWTGMTICFSHFYGLDHLKNKKMERNIFVHLFKRYWEYSSRLPRSYLSNPGSRCAVIRLQFSPTVEMDT